MPFYEYRCHTCAHEFELMRPMKDRDVPLPCPHCASESIERKLSAFAAPAAATASAPCGAPKPVGGCGSSGFG